MPLLVMNAALLAAILPVADLTRGSDSAVPYRADEAQLDSVPPASFDTYSVSIDGLWRLSWDDVVGQELSEDIKQCDIRFRVIDGKVSGEFVGPVAGTERDALIGGELVQHADGCVLVFTQREAGYVCTYQINWPTSQGITSAVGTWCDTKGRRGNFSFLKYQ